MGCQTRRQTSARLAKAGRCLITRGHLPAGPRLAGRESGEEKAPAANGRTAARESPTGCADGRGRIITQRTHLSKAAQELTVLDTLPG